MKVETALGLGIALCIAGIIATLVWERTHPTRTRCEYRDHVTICETDR